MLHSWPGIPFLGVKDLFREEFFFFWSGYPLLGRGGTRRGWIWIWIWTGSKMMIQIQIQSRCLNWVWTCNTTLIPPTPTYVFLFTISLSIVQNGRLCLWMKIRRLESGVSWSGIRCDMGVETLWWNSGDFGDIPRGNQCIHLVVPGEEEGKHTVDTTWWYTRGQRLTSSWGKNWYFFCLFRKRQLSVTTWENYILKLHDIYFSTGRRTKKGNRGDIQDTTSSDAPIRPGDHQCVITLHLTTQTKENLWISPRTIRQCGVLMQQVLHETIWHVETQRVTEECVLGKAPPPPSQVNTHH